MSLRNVLAGTAVAAGLMMIGAPRVDAAPLPIGSYTGPIQLTFNNYEDFLTPGGTIDATGPHVGDQNFGIFNVLQISKPGIAGTLWSSGDAGQLLVGVFNNIIVSSVTGPTGAEQTNNTGGVFELFSVSVAQFLAAGGDQGLAGYANAGCALASLCYHGITDVPSSSPVLTMTLTPGIDPTDPTATLVGTVNATLAPPTGTAAFNALVSGNNQLAVNVSAKDSFCPNTTASGCPGADNSTFAIASQDPIVGTAVPEPASMALIGSGLLALGVARSRRQKKTDLRQ